MDEIDNPLYRSTLLRIIEENEDITTQKAQWKMVFYFSEIAYVGTDKILKYIDFWYKANVHETDLYIEDDGINMTQEKVEAIVKKIRMNKGNQTELQTAIKLQFKRLKSKGMSEYSFVELSKLDNWSSEETKERVLKAFQDTLSHQQSKDDAHQMFTEK